MRIELFDLYKDENIYEIRCSEKYNFYQNYYFQILINQDRIIDTLKIYIKKNLLKFIMVRTGKLNCLRSMIFMSELRKNSNIC